MGRSLDAGWLPKAVDLCMNSAAAYKAAFMLADNAWDERRLLDLVPLATPCSSASWGNLAVKWVQRKCAMSWIRASAGPFHHQTIDAALAAALICDRGLSLMIGADLRILSSNARSPAQPPHSPCASIPRSQPMAQAAGACA